jgi:hypothetical protein
VRRRTEGGFRKSTQSVLPMKRGYREIGSDAIA